MKTAITAVFQKKTTWIAIIGIITSLFGAWLAKHGFDTSKEHTDRTAEAIAGFWALVVVQQTAADFGKEKAKIEQSNVQIDPPGPTPGPEGGFARLDTLAMVMFLGVGVALVATACGAFQSEVKHAASDAVDCMAPKLLESSRELGSVLDRSLPVLLSDTGKVDRAGFKSLTSGLKSDAAGCAIAAALNRLTQPRGQDSQAAPLSVDAPDVWDAWATVRTEQFGGRAFAVGGS